MTIELWYSTKPNNPGEQGVLIELYDFLRSQHEHFVMMACFYAGPSNEIDLMVLKQNGLFLAEIKHVWGKVIGHKSGLWTYTNPNGITGTLDNPYLQVRSSHHNWKKWCQEHLDEMKKIGSLGIAVIVPHIWRSPQANRR